MFANSDTGFVLGACKYTPPVCKAPSFLTSLIHNGRRSPPVVEWEHTDHRFSRCLPEGTVGVAPLALNFPGQLFLGSEVSAD